LKSAGLYGEDKASGEKGYNLAAVMLLGRDDVIKNVSPAYRTDALLRKVNIDRYDDRLIAETNLIESFDLLTEFAAKHLWDKFYLEGGVRISLRDEIAREMLANCLIHREFTSPFFAKFIIMQDRMVTENANRAVTGEAITLENYTPNPKNPLIASFFRNIGLADELGSGVRRLYYYSRRYSGQDPQLVDGDVFRIVVPLDDAYSFDAEKDKPQTANRKPQTANRKRGGLYGETVCAPTELAVLAFLRKNPTATHNEIANAVGKSVRTVQSAVSSLKKKELLAHEGARNNGRWIVTQR
jgi:ATP-dependent DNA helicase RecG